MKNILSILIIATLIFSGSAIKAQGYVLDFNDATTYSITCGNITTSQWTVKNNICVLTTPFFKKETVGNETVRLQFRVNQSGNGEYTDILSLEHQMDNGLWITDTTIHQSAYSEVHNISIDYSLNFGDVIRFRVDARTDDNNEFWSIKSGEFSLTGSFTTYPDVVSLPVEITDYKLRCTSTGSLFTWTTASETNNDYFTIEKSENMLDWKISSTLSGAFNSNNEIEYESIDEDMVKDKTVYYRLKQTDVDGKFKYFDVLSILCSFNNDLLEIIGVNASEVGVNLIVKTNGLSPVNIYLSDMTGKIVAEKEITPVKGANLISLENTGLSSGIYIAKIVQDDKVNSKKIYLGTSR